ncbi:MAG: hypothetical protein ABSB35_18480 [Bryobacteraceae bacterium]|jgi:ElaB/YqjD/DUF883 family membrane-anchored ribosome-binding protein
MKSVLDEPKVEPETEVRAKCTCGGLDAEEVSKRIEKGMNDVKAAVSEKLEDGKIAAERLLKRGRYAVEDCMTETEHQIKHHPVSSIAIAFAAGAALGLLVPRPVKK